MQLKIKEYGHSQQENEVFCLYHTFTQFVSFLTLYYLRQCMKQKLGTLKYRNASNKETNMSSLDRKCMPSIRKRTENSSIRAVRKAITKVKVAKILNGCWILGICIAMFYQQLYQNHKFLSKFLLPPLQQDAPQSVTVCKSQDDEVYNHIDLFSL